MDEILKEVHENPPKNWREVWSKRVLITCSSNRKTVERYIDKNKEKCEYGMSIDVHPKDGYVVYAEPEEYYKH